MGLFGKRVPAGPLRRVLLGWQACHGDALETMAIGFGLERSLVERLIGPDPARTLSVDEARTCCVGLRAHPEEIWPQRCAARLGSVDWETEVLWIDAGVDPVVFSGLRDADTVGGRRR